VEPLIPLLCTTTTVYLKLEVGNILKVTLIPSWIALSIYQEGMVSKKMFTLAASQDCIK